MSTKILVAVFFFMLISFTLFSLFLLLFAMRTKKKNHFSFQWLLLMHFLGQFQRKIILQKKIILGFFSIISFSEFFVVSRVISSPRHILECIILIMSLSKGECWIFFYYFWFLNRFLSKGECKNQKMSILPLFFTGNLRSF